MKMRYAVLAAALALAFAPAALAGFSLDDNGKELTVLEDGKPVLVYNYAMVDPPEGVPGQYRRACYVHPLYGLDGEVMTQDFPFDHRHHRGVFWAWPKTTVGEREADVWTIIDVRQVHEKWVGKEAGPDSAVIAAQNTWQFEDDPENPPVREDVRFVVHPAGELGRAIDYTLTLTNIGDKEVTIRGQSKDDKGYGGFCFRPDAMRKPMHFTSALGRLEEDMLYMESPWADCSFPKEKGGEDLSGVAIFQHPDNPGYPHPGWITRAYGFLGVSWPHNDPYPLKPGESVTLRYRVYVHRGGADAAGVSQRFDEFVQAEQ